MHAFRPALLALAFVLGLAPYRTLAAAASPLKLSSAMPDRMGDDFTARTLSLAAQSGWQDAGILGKPWMLVRDNHVAGILVSGQYQETRAKGSNMVCFLAYFRFESDKGRLLPTIGQGRSAAELCSGYKALGLLPAPAGTVRLGILYDAALRGKGIDEPVIFTWKLGQTPVVDTAASANCLRAEASTIADMRKTGCGSKVLPWANPNSTSRTPLDPTGR